MSTRLACRYRAMIRSASARLPAIAYGFARRKASMLRAARSLDLETAGWRTHAFEHVKERARARQPCHWPTRNR